MKKEKEKKKKREKKREEFPILAFDGSPSTEDKDKELANFVRMAGGKWKLRILLALQEGEYLRYGKIRVQISGITDMMLSKGLRELTENGLILRRQYEEIPPKVEYCLTTEAAALLPAIHLLCTWSKIYAV